MILARAVFQAKVGKAQELVASFKAAMQQSDADQLRISPNLSGRFDTVVVETVAESRAEWERRRIEMFASPGSGGINVVTQE